jgi:hypothetical protein
MGMKTGREHVEVLDDMFFESLAMFDRCQTQYSADKTTAAKGTEENGKDGPTGNVGAEMDSVASTLTGDVPKSTAVNVPTSSFSQVAPKTLKNGQLPEDIPSSDNDSLLEAQIKTAAMAETDPARKMKLWNEYRRYKGLRMKDEMPDEN